MTTTTACDEPRAATRRHTTAAYLLLALGPPAAWVVWISWDQEAFGDGRHVAFFATVAGLCLLAGALAVPTRRHLVGLLGVGVTSSVATIWAWWSSIDDSGLFVIGVLLAVPCLVGAGLALLLLGRALARRADR